MIVESFKFVVALKVIQSFMPISHLVSACLLSSFTFSSLFHSRCRIPSLKQDRKGREACPGRTSKIGLMKDINDGHYGWKSQRILRD